MGVVINSSKKRNKRLGIGHVYTLLLSEDSVTVNVKKLSVVPLRLLRNIHNYDSNGSQYSVI